ncbi:hypothetical protein G3145_004746 [Salmonella enterica subsp. enterica serovar Montevideo]|nr:hypothetical protein [Salmonella enterica subsp. enterica serovar Bonariensis]EDS5123837.1 hypothetical protein [Salmonella enterica subsp. enterica serovar Mississippi]EDS9466559.1 hypothetical protein [Salmonella enterica subsp. enterica serovar Panama]EDZ8561601.1 hypothetical protein [Salmonella enterica]EEH4254969.1 hypothetical protein [Salmonella enterica subsp. enterica serovar Montevideo]
MISATVWIAAKPYNCIVQYNSYGDSCSGSQLKSLRLAISGDFGSH